MKTNSNLGKKFMALCMTAFISTSLLTSCNKDDEAVNDNPYTITGDANGAKVVPSVTDTGTAKISGSYNASTNLLTYTTNWTGLSGGPTSGGFYNGASGVTGTAIGSSWAFTQPTTVTGSRSDTLTLTEDQEAQLLEGNWYYTLKTTKNPNGEVRGQMTATR